MAAGKTSHSHPLKIARVRVPGGGIIGLTLCPGKKHRGQFSGLWNRNLDIDLLAIQNFGARALITLMETPELAKVKVPVPTLRVTARRLGLKWYHLPIKDGEVPDDRFERRWADTGAHVCDILARRGKVVLHCRGGLGRTGTIAGSLLVAFGVPPESAIAQIRQARPGCISTDAQENYIRNCSWTIESSLRSLRELKPD